MGAARVVFTMAFASLLAVANGCASEDAPVIWVKTPGPDLDASLPSSTMDARAPRPDSAGPTGPAEPVPPGTCRQAHGPPLQARLSVMASPSEISTDGGDAAASDEMSVEASVPQGQRVYLTNLLGSFNSLCGSCHGANSPRDTTIATTGDFHDRMTSVVLSHVISNGGPGEPTLMPPDGDPNSRPYRDRPESDPVKQFAERVQGWLDAGKPESFFVPVVDESQTTPVSVGADIDATPDYTLSPDNANAMTGIGNCVPSRELFAIEQTRSAQLDALFAAASRSTAPDATPAERLGLPIHLRETDLFTLDSNRLAQFGVVAFAPGYPLWSDNAGKLRHIRVPRGTSIRFDKATQRFEIPPNTRFYKTFMKPVIELDGSMRWKKMETRLIVARPNPPGDDDSATPSALFGTYQWDDDEKDATLVQTPLRSGTPFSDTIVRYVVDEPLAEAVRLSQPATEEQALLDNKATRNYAIPSSDRCIECHRGAQGRDFVLGFLPVQINRRPVGEGGVIETSWPDELTQLQRFIDYGIITGVDSSSDVVPLEKSQGSRTPRNDYELVAQGYMLGNCSHCHNPHGLPSVQSPELKDILNFLPGPKGGIFQFPLDRSSPRIVRGVKTPVQIPYITPSLLDYPDPDATPQLAATIIDGSVDGEGVHIRSAIYAPWRSLIYRNVDAAFAYTYDLALFPHMPRNVPGYDPRAKQILSDWMVSIPAVRFHAERDEYQLRASSTVALVSVDDSPQPYFEIMPGDKRYNDAVRGAAIRLEVLHSGVNPAVPLDPLQLAYGNAFSYSRYADPGDAFDILDPEVLRDPACHPIPTPAIQTAKNPYPFANHPHWVTTDLSEPTAGAPWAPRRSDWRDTLIAQNVRTANDCQQPDAVADALRDQKTAVKLLQNVTLDSVIRNFVTTEIPYGLWKQNKGCRFDGINTVKDYKNQGAYPQWMDSVPNPPQDAPIYLQTPGAAIFKMICINCHGPLADSRGRLAENLATMTGGLSRVANFREGLFGPSSNPVFQHMNDEFSKPVPDGWITPTGGILPEAGIAPDAGISVQTLAQWTNITPEDVAARYMAWMALGGTFANVPQDILTIVGATQVLGERRKVALSGSANMLSNAKTICKSFLGPYDWQTYGKQPPILEFNPKEGHAYLDFDTPTLIRVNGDAEMWMKLCTLNNPAPIHIIQYYGGGAPKYGMQATVIPGQRVTNASFLLSRNGYTGRVGNEHGPGTVRGGDVLDESNLWPWCVQPVGTNDFDPQNLGYPLCPTFGARSLDEINKVVEEVDQWAVRGAINAGLAVFLYVKSLETGAPAPDYDHCESLP